MSWPAGTGPGLYKQIVVNYEPNKHGQFYQVQMADKQIDCEIHIHVRQGINGDTCWKLTLECSPWQCISLKYSAMQSSAVRGSMLCISVL